MITNVMHGEIGDREDALDVLEENKFARVLDVGASINPWAHNYITHAADLNPLPNTSWHQFIGNICEPFVWDEIKKDCELNGKFDFVICTHTLEDILNPVYVMQQMASIGKAGYIAIPSKWRELSRKGHRPWVGWMHHRWIFDVIDSEVVCAPKLVYMDHLQLPSFSTRPEELRFFWEGELKCSILNNDFIGPSEEAYLEKLTHFLNL
jgi:hypothetical protein